MIQRIQTVWLLLATIVLILMLFLPIATNIGGQDSAVYVKGMQQSLSGDGFLLKSNIPMLTTAILIIVVCFVNIFNFRKRSMQKKVIILTIVAIIGFAVWCSVYLKQLPGIEGASFGVGAYLPALAILFLVLAIFGINNDERLIRSAERLR